jgi:O-antigen/teichoic acid export membrane protein
MSGSSETQRSPRAIHGATAALGSRLATKALGLVLLVIIARRLGPGGFASYSYLLVLASAVIVITDSGVAAVAARAIASGDADVGRAYRAAGATQLATTLVGAAVVAGAGVVARGPGFTDGALAWTTGVVLANGVFNLQAEVLRGAARPWAEAALQLVCTVLQIAGSLAVLARHGGVGGLMAVLALTTLATAGLAQLALPWPTRSAPDPTLRWTLFRQGIWLGVGTTLMAVMWRLPQLIFGNAASIPAVADFAVATRYLETGTMLCYTAAIGIFPALSRRSVTEPGAMTALIRRLLAGCVAFGALVAAPGVVLVHLVTVPVFGRQYAGAVPVASIFVGAAPLILLFHMAWYALVVQHRERTVMIGSAAGAAAAALGGAVVVVHASATTAAAVTLIAVGAATVPFVAVAWRSVSSPVGVPS